MESLSHVRAELTEDTIGCLMRGHRLVIPSTLTARVVQLAHLGHQGMVKTKSRLRTKVWFPLMDEMVEAAVRGCSWCLVTGEMPRPTHIITEPRPWVKASLDFGSLPDG